MYCKKLKDIADSKEGIKNNIDYNFIKRFDTFLRDETTERERLKLNPIKVSNEMNIPQKLIMEFFTIGKKVGLFKPRAFYSCSCSEHFEIFNLNNIECENHCEIDITKNRNRIYVYFQLVDELEDCNFGDYGEYQMDYISQEDLGNFQGTLADYDKVIGVHEANKLIENSISECEEKLREIRIAHVSDLHFGSEHNTGIDNKSGLKSIDDISSKAFDSFKKIVENDEIDFLIVSGDLTSKNEEIGLELFEKSIKDLKINQENIYIVPGNHECDRSSNTEKGQFALFSMYTNFFHTPFSKECYILDGANKCFIYGFNSVNFKKEDDKELFYVKDSDIRKVESICNDLNKKIDGFEDYSKIAVIHNNLIPSPSIEVKEYSELLNLYTIKYKLARLGFKVVCSGHKHEEIIEKHTIYNNGREREIILLSAPSLSGTVYNTRNGFQIIKLFRDSLDKLVKIIIQKYEFNSLREFSNINDLEIKI